MQAERALAEVDPGLIFGLLTNGRLWVLSMKDSFVARNCSGSFAADAFHAALNSGDPGGLPANSLAHGLPSSLSTNLWTVPPFGTLCHLPSLRSGVRLVIW